MNLEHEDSSHGGGDENKIDISTPEGIAKVAQIFAEQNISPDVPPDSSREQIWLSGNLDTFLATSEDTNGQYALFDLYVPPLAGPVAHFHTREDEVYQLLSGEVVFQEGNLVRKVVPGELIPLHRGHLHRFENLGTTPARLLLLATPAGLDNSFREAGQPVTDPSAPPPPDDLARVIAAAIKQGIEVYPEASFIGRPIVNDGGIDLYGDADSETIVGTNGSDLILGRNGQDTLLGKAGDDIIIGGLDSDQIDGGRGNDLISAREGNDFLTGGGDQDTFLIRLGNGIDTISDFGGVGVGNKPSATVVAEVDTLQFEGLGLSARNLLLTQTGKDLLVSFDGIENTGAILKDFTLEKLDNLTKATGASVDIGNILFNGQTKIEDSFDVFNANQQRDTVFNKNSVTFLNDLNNIIQGFNGSNDVINGQGGDDKIKGLAGNDLLRGQAGDDILIGDAGDDILDGGIGDDILIAGSAHDFLQHSAWKSITSIAEVLTAIEATGSSSAANAGNDLLIGGAGNDTLIGSSGNDTLNGGTGNDTLVGGLGGDRFVIAAGSGTDTIIDFNSFDDLIELSNSLQFSDLTITQGTTNNTFIELTSSNELLAILAGIQASSLTNANFSFA